MAQSQHSRNRPSSASLARAGLLDAPPPEVLRRSPLYRALPEAKLHEADASILDRLRAINAHAGRVAKPSHVVQADISALLRDTQGASQRRRLSAAGANVTRPTTASTMDRGATSLASQNAPGTKPVRASSAALRRPAWNESVGPAPNSPVGRPGKHGSTAAADRRLRDAYFRPPACKLSGAEAERHNEQQHQCATEQMLSQQAAVAQYVLAHRHHSETVADEREQRWSELRAAKEAEERRLRLEGAKRRQLNQAFELAEEKIVEQKREERALVQHNERAARSEVERGQRRDRHRLALALWSGAQAILFYERSELVQSSECVDRRMIVSECMGELETRVRHGISRLYTMTRTHILSLEKVERVSLQKYVAARTQWRATLDAQVNAFLAHERKVRQKLHDEEAFSFIEIDSARQQLLLEEAKARRRVEEARQAALRDFELMQHNERVDAEREENDSRGIQRNDEATFRARLRNDFVDEKKAAAEKTKKRVAQEKSEWAAECARQQQPIIDDEGIGRREIDVVWGKQFNTMLSTYRQELDDLLIPVIAFAHAPHISAPTHQIGGSAPLPIATAASPTKSAAPGSPTGPRAGKDARNEVATATLCPVGESLAHVAYASFGLPCVLFPFPAVRKKEHGMYAGSILAGAIATISVSHGACTGDDVELQATAVTSVKEKLKVPGLRSLMDGSIVAEDGAHLAVWTKLTGSSAETEGADTTAMQGAGEDAGDADEMLEGGAASGPGRGEAIEVGSLDFVFGEGTELVAAELAIMRCLRHLTFRTSATNTDHRSRTVDVELKVACGRPQKAKAGKRGDSLGSALLKSQYQWFTLIIRSQIAVRPAVLRPIRCGAARYAVLYDLRTHRHAGKPSPVSLMPSASLPLLSSEYVIAGSVLKLRFVDGFSPDDVVSVLAGDGIQVRKTDIRADGQAFAKVSGKFQTAASKEIVFSFVSDQGVILPDAFERFIRRLQFGVSSESPAKGNRVIEISYQEADRGPTRTAPSTSLSFVCRIEVIVAGTTDDVLACHFDPHEPTVFRDSISAASVTWKKFVSSDTTLVCPELALDPRGSLVKGDVHHALQHQLVPGGTIRAVVAFAASNDDVLSVSVNNLVPGVGSFHLGSGQQLLFAPVASSSDGHRHDVFDDDAGGYSGASAEAEAAMNPGSYTAERGRKVAIAKITTSGRQRLALELIPGPELKLVVLQQLLRSIAFSAPPAPESMGCNKLIAIDVNVGDSITTGAVAGSVLTSPTSPSRVMSPLNRSRGPVAAASAASFTSQFRICRLLQVRPTVVRCRTSLVTLPRLTTPQLLVGLRVASDGLDDRYDGGYVRIDFVDGRSAFEQLALTGPPRENEASGSASKAANTQRASSAGASAANTPRVEGGDKSPTARLSRAASSAGHSGSNADDAEDDAISVASSASLEEDPTEGLAFVQGGGGSEVAIIHHGEIVGTVAECAPGRPLIIKFAKSRVPLHAPSHAGDEASHALSTSSAPRESATDAPGGMPRVSFPVTGYHLRAVLRNLWYQHSEADSALEKAIRIVAQDAEGRRSQAVVGLHIEANFCPTVCVNPPDIVYYRHHWYPELRNELMPLFTQSTLEDDDTENVGKCTMSLEPYDGVTADDVIELARPTATWPAVMRRFTFVDHPVDVSRTSICFDGREIAWAVNQITGTPDAPRGNAIFMTIKAGTALTVCTYVMRLLAYSHREAQPRRTHPRQYEFRFNAGDEDVPDTRCVFAVHVGPPLLSNLPIHSAVRFRENTSGAQILPQPIVGVPLATSCAGDVIRFELRDTQDADVVGIASNDSILLDDKYLVASLAFARQLSPTVSAASPGLSGVLVGTVKYIGDTELEVEVDRHCALPTAVMPAVFRSLVFRNTSRDPSDSTRQALVTWSRFKTKECGFIKVAASVEPEDDMTEVTLAASIVACFAFEECRFAYNALVSDADTPLFEKGSSLEVELIGPCDHPPMLSTATRDFSVVNDLLYFGTREIGTWALEKPRKLRVDLTDCPLDVLEKLVGAVAVVNTDRQRASKVVQLTIRGSPDVTPTVENVQLNVLPRALSYVSNAPVMYVFGSGPVGLFCGGVSAAQMSFSGATIVVALATQQNLMHGGPANVAKRPVIAGVTFDPTPSHPENYRLAVPGADRLALSENVADDWAITKSAIIHRASSQPVCSLEILNHSTAVQLTFPKASKVPPATIAGVLGLLTFESSRSGATVGVATDGGPANPSRNAGAKPGPKATPASPAKAAGKPSAVVPTQAVPAGAESASAGLEGAVKIVITTAVPHVESTAVQVDFRYVELLPPASGAA
jgi:hypothetical protein